MTYLGLFFFIFGLGMIHPGLALIALGLLFLIPSEK